MKQIESLKLQQATARATRQKIARDLRNAQRRKRRLKTRARQLRIDDLVTVLLMRADDTEPVADAGEAPSAAELLASQAPAKKAKKD